MNASDPYKNISKTSDSTYYIEKECNLLDETIQDLKVRNIFLSENFEANEWILTNPNISGRTHTIDFTDFKVYSKEKLTTIKYWVGNLLSKYKTTTCYFYFYTLKKVIIKTNFFSSLKVDEFIKWLIEGKINDNIRAYSIYVTMNFLDYSEIEQSDIYLSKLYSINKNIKYSRMQRSIPTSKNILRFSYYLERYFNDLQGADTPFTDEETKKKYLLFFPILLWWKLTTIIPLRSTEFSSIQRDCIIKKDSKYFVKLPRKKRKLIEKKNIQIVDEIEIHEELFDLIRNYTKLTKDLGNTSTLISYPSLIYADDLKRSQRIMQKRDTSQFNRENLDKLLRRFYREVIKDGFKIFIPKDQQLSPNDTRHIAFTSLMLQGVSPIEIARIGGHKTIKAQYHYSYHVEYWVDNEVFKLLKRVKFNNIKNSNGFGFIPKSIKLKAFEPPTSKFIGKLSIGYCSDELQRCESTDCMRCSHWRINPEELNEKDMEIRKKIASIEKNTHDLLAFIKQLHYQIIEKGKLNNIKENINSFQTTTNQISSEIENIAALKILLNKELD